MLKRLIEMATLQDEADALRKYWSDDLLAEVELAWVPIKAGPVEEWKNLSREIRAAAAAREDPAGEKAQAIGARYAELMKRDGPWFKDLMQLVGKPEVRAASEKALADRENWPAGLKARIEKTGMQQTVPFLRKVMAAQPGGLAKRPSSHSRPAKGNNAAGQV